MTQGFFDQVCRHLRSFQLLTLLALSLSSCGVWGPSAGEDEDIGSNTNWLKSCSQTEDCGESLECICGACSRYCSAESDCDDGLTCPVGLGAFQMACPSEVIAAPRSSCRAGCKTDADCAASALCVDHTCIAPDVEPCPTVHELVWDSEPGALQARVGSLFGEGYYIPERTQAAAGEGAYRPTNLLVRALDANGIPVSGCEVILTAAQTSGYAFASNPVTDAEGKVSFLWVAGTATDQTMRAQVLSQDSTWLTVSAAGTARRHDEAPLSSSAAPLTTTRASSLGLEFAPETPTSGVRVHFEPLAFPPRTIYGALKTDSLEIWFVNAGTEPATEGTVPAAFRHMSLRVAGTPTIPARVLFSENQDGCYEDGDSLVCPFRDAWTLNERLVVQVDARQLVPTELVSDYEFGAAPPCDGEDGCTDYTVLVQRPGGPLELHAVLRSPTLDTLSNRRAFIDGDYNEADGMASSCLLTDKSAFRVAHEVRETSGWMFSQASELEAAEFSAFQDVCANYAAFANDDSYYLTTGGPSAVATPHSPELPLRLQ